MAEDGFEAVIFVAACAAVPWAGLAHFRGQPFSFEPRGFMWWAEEPDATAADEDYALVPVPAAAIPLLVERMTFEARRHGAFATGQAAKYDPVLPEDRPRYERITEQLRDFAISSKEERVARATFRRIAPPHGDTPPRWEVRWMPITDEAFEDGRLRPFRPAV